MTPAQRVERTLRRALLSFSFLAISLLGQGCQIDIVRTRGGKAVHPADFERLEVQTTTRNEVLDRLGAPEKAEWKSGEDYFWYLHTDTILTGVRFQFPPFGSVLGYKHTFLQMNENSEETDAMALVFGEDGVLKRKSLRLSKAYEAPGEDLAGWWFHFVPHFEHSLLLQGDGGIVDYNRMFDNGLRAGLNLGFQPVPVLTLLVSGNFQEYQGRAVRKSGSRVSFDDLQLYQVEIGIRLSAPLSLLGTLTDFDTVKRVLFDDNLSKSRGLRFFLQGTTGLSRSSNVRVKVDGVRAGNFYDGHIGLTGTLEAGLEHNWTWGSAHIGILYQSVDAFDEGNTTLDDRGDSFQGLFVGGGIGVKF
ncbi:MAG TPA: hypothetical protein VMT52_10935 [Planctomycetota bacterium]|nr:hypothetical protein [Planctomycetota bacterium]